MVFPVLPKGASETISASIRFKYDILKTQMQDDQNMFNIGYENTKDQLIVEKTKLEAMTDHLKEIDDNLQSKTEEAEQYKKIIMILTECSSLAREKARLHFEKIITEALQYVTQSEDYQFVIQEKEEGSKAAYDFYIKTTVNGEESLQNPKDANGGGFIDIISVAAKYAYLQLFNNPVIKNSSVILDEPGKMIDEQRSISFAEYIKELGNAYDKQTIMITHNNSLSSVADKTYYVSQDGSMISKISELQDTELSDIESLVKEKIDGH